MEGRANKCFHSLVAQLVEHVTVNHGVSGSSPGGGAKLKVLQKSGRQRKQEFQRFRSHIAQLVEYVTVNHGVPGSSPGVGANLVQLIRLKCVASSCDDVAEMDRQMIANHFYASSSLAVISKLQSLKKLNLVVDSVNDSIFNWFKKRFKA